MNSKILGLLEFNKITNLLAQQAGSALTKKRINELKPAVNMRQVSDALTETTEAVSVIMYKGSIPIGEIGDIRDLLKMARKGRCLSMRELLKIKSTLTITRQAKTFLTSDVPDNLKIIAEIAELLAPVPKLEKDIDSAILSDDEMSDNASSALKNIRREIRNKNDQIKSRMQKITSSQTSSKFLQDSIVTIRNGRYVIPVKREYASMFPGLVHDQSSTGATLFIEPQSIVTMNNELRQLEMDEQAEITRILQLFSSRVAEHHHEILNNQNLLAELDYINAKGKLSILMDGREPKINDKGIIDIKSGRHPLLDPEKAVPINVELGRDFSTLLITGPNTGGKTVTLKTIGLLIIMAQSGLHVPCYERSELPVLNEVFADIGDEQSIEQSLSTFSSHMKNITDIFAVAGRNTLVLLDELGAGSEPSEGAALGIAELEKLREMGALVVATTHYTELKKYALSTPGVENASMEFNVETLSPTYKLRLGLPGKSNAFEISRKLGLSEAIITRAAELLGENQMDFENAVTRVEEDRKRAEDILAEARAKEAEAADILAKADKKVKASQEKADRILEEAREKARAMLRDAQGTVDEVSSELKDIRKTAQDHGHTSNAIAASRRKLRSAEDDYQSKAKKARSVQTGKAPKPEDLAIGMQVKLTTIGQTGEVETLPDSRGNLTVRIGMLKTTANIKNLIIAESAGAGNKEKKRKAYAGGARQTFVNDKVRNVKTEINVIGRNLDDALYEVQKYIDDAYIAGLHQVRIVHGKGQGILASGIRDALKKYKQVKSCAPAAYNEGGEGATIVILKEKK
ncbi:MAG: endonuclease MutS2 [Clostridiales bacterium]|nr:endonuclease MutS2 [Candidatus Crickella merdequi]